MIGMLADLRCGATRAAAEEHHVSLVSVVCDLVRPTRPLKLLSTLMDLFYSLRFGSSRQTLKNDYFLNLKVFFPSHR